MKCISSLNCFRENAEHTSSIVGTSSVSSAKSGREDYASQEDSCAQYDDFEISDESIGAGASGSIYPATFRTFEHNTNSTASPIQNIAGDLVVKRVDAKFKPFLLQEYLVLRTVTHRNILKTFAMFPSPDQQFYFMVMERIFGMDLERVVAQHGPLNDYEALTVMENLFSALAQLHGIGIGHMDIKPGNLMLRNSLESNRSRPNENHRVDSVLVDFGLSVTCPHPQMISRRVYNEPRGTLVYGAPELGSGKPFAIDKADIWSCGITLYELVSGNVPYDLHDYSGGFSQMRNIIYETGSITELYSEKDGSSCSRAPPPSPYIRCLLESCLSLSPERRPTALEALHLVRQLQESHPMFERGIT